MGKIELITLAVLAIVVLFVGAKKLPELARGVGQSAKELKRGFTEDVATVAPAKADSEK